MKVDKVDLGGKPESLVADDKGRAFVCVNDKNAVAVVDVKTLKVKHTTLFGLIFGQRAL